MTRKPGLKVYMVMRDTNDGQRGDGFHRRFRTAAVAVVWAAVLAFASGTGMPAVASEGTDDRREGVPQGSMAQFQLPSSFRHGQEGPARPLVPVRVPPAGWSLDRSRPGVLRRR